MSPGLDTVRIVKGMDHVTPQQFASMDQSPIADELAAMAAIAEHFNHLDPAARNRALQWAKDRYQAILPGTEGIMAMLNEMLQAIGEHQGKTAQPSTADKAMWDATIKGTRYYQEPKASKT